MTAWRLKAACFDHPDLAPDAWDTPAEVEALRRRLLLGEDA